MGSCTFDLVLTFDHSLINGSVFRAENIVNRDQASDSRDDILTTNQNFSIHPWSVRTTRLSRSWKGTQRTSLSWKECFFGFPFPEEEGEIFVWDNGKFRITGWWFFLLLMFFFFRENGRRRRRSRSFPLSLEQSGMQLVVHHHFPRKVMDFFQPFLISFSGVGSRSRSRCMSWVRSMCSDSHGSISDDERDMICLLLPTTDYYYNNKCDCLTFARHIGF